MKNLFLLLSVLVLATGCYDDTRQLAEEGDAAAQFDLGVNYYLGRDVPKNDAEAAKWFHLAAEQGYAAAQHNLGVMYYLGEGVPQDYVETYVWSSMAAAQGNESARENRDEVAVMLSESELAAARARVAELTEKIEGGQ